MEEREKERERESAHTHSRTYTEGKMIFFVKYLVSFLISGDLLSVIQV